MSSVRSSWRLPVRLRERPACDAPPRLLAAWFALAAHGEQPSDESGDATLPSATLRAFETFFREHERPVFGYLWRITGDEQVAYDLSQETFLRAWRHFERIRSYALPDGWLFRVATNLALNYLRHKRVVAGLVVSSVDADSALDSVVTPAADPTAHLANDELVRDVLLELAPRPRAVLVLHDVYGFTAAEIAGMLAMTTAAVKMMLSRARERFRVRYLHDDQEARP